MPQVNYESQTMSHKVVRAVAATRCRRSVVETTRSETVLVTSHNVVLLENSLLNVISTVHNSIFKHKQALPHDALRLLGLRRSSARAMRDRPR